MKNGFFLDEILLARDVNFFIHSCDNFAVWFLLWWFLVGYGFKQLLFPGAPGFRDPFEMWFVLCVPFLCSPQLCRTFHVPWKMFFTTMIENHKRHGKKKNSTAEVRAVQSSSTYSYPLKKKTEKWERKSRCSLESYVESTETHTKRGQGLARVVLLFMSWRKRLYVRCVFCNVCVRVFCMCVVLLNVIRFRIASIQGEKHWEGKKKAKQRKGEKNWRWGKKADEIHGW